MEFRDIDIRAGLQGWEKLRAGAALHRGVRIAAPVFWSAFSIFVDPLWGCVGFTIHATLTLPRRGHAILLLLVAYPSLALWFAVREPFATLPDIPFHREFPGMTREAPPEAFLGIVEDVPTPSARGFNFLFRPLPVKPDKAIPSDNPRYRVNLITRGDPPPWGALIRLRGIAEPASPALNPGQLDMRRVLRAQGAAAILEADDWETLHPPSKWKSWLMRTRAALDASLGRHVAGPALPLLEASLLNITANVPDDTRNAFLRSGMQHILAISGQHIGLLLAFLLFAGLAVRLPRKAAFVLAALLTAAYIPLVGSPVSVVRSGIMLACLLPALLLERPSGGLHAFCLTASIDLLLDPHNILNLGFQLSYAATLALILCARPSQKLAVRILQIPSGWWQGVVQMFLLSGCVSLCTYPMLAASTHATTPWGVVGNAFTVPIGAAMLVGGLCTWSLDFIGRAFGILLSVLPHHGFSPLSFLSLSALSDATGAATGACALALEGCVFFLASLPGALLPIADPSPAWIAALCATCAVALLMLRGDRPLLACLCVAVLIAAEASRPAFARLVDTGPDGARITFLAVGHGDAAILELPGAVIGIDAGDSPRIARNVIIPFLQARGIAHLDLLLITHPDRDHYGGAAALLERIPVGALIGPPQTAESSPTWNCLRATARAQEVSWHEGRAGERVYTGRRVSLQMLGPDSTLDGADKNDRSLVALLQTPGGSVLFTGDIEQPGQQALAASWPLWRGAWLKAPHHGSDRTTDPCFLRDVSPPRTVISCGSRRGFPGAHTVATLTESGSHIAITKYAGAITWRFGNHDARENRHHRPPPDQTSDAPADKPN